MKLEDPQLIEAKPTYYKPVEPFVYKSLRCRNGKCSECGMIGCECGCHKHDKQALIHELSRSGVRQCRSIGCTQDARRDTCWCEDCHVGLTPSQRDLKKAGIK